MFYRIYITITCTVYIVRTHTPNLIPRSNYYDFISFILYYIIFIIIIIFIYYIYLPLPQKIHRCLPEEGNSFDPSGILEMSTLLEYVYKFKPIHTVRILYSV